MRSNASLPFSASPTTPIYEAIARCVLREDLELLPERMRGRPLEIADRVARITAADDPPHSAQRRKVVGRNGEDYFLLDADEACHPGV